MVLEILGALIVAVAIAVGASAHYISKKNDSAVEQISEAVLHSKGIDIDFSADDKKAEQEKAQESKQE